VLLSSEGALGAQLVRVGKLDASFGNATVMTVNMTLSSLKEAEKGLVNELFTFVRGLLDEKGNSGDSKGWRQMGASDGHGELGEINPAYHRITTKKGAEIAPKFETKCASLVTEMVKKRLHFLEQSFSKELIGMDIATHFQVQCPGAIPMAEEKCDKHASTLANLVDEGKIVPEAGNVKPEDWYSGNQFLQLHGDQNAQTWCKAFFKDFWDSVTAQVVAATPQRAPIGPSGSGKLSPYGPSTVNEYGPTDHWTPR
jgi:hypothetical protein